MPRNTIKTMSASKSALMAVGLAVVAEAIVWLLFNTFGHIGGDGPDTAGAVGLVFHFPGVMVADFLHLNDTKDAIVIAFTGGVQFFLIFWLVITLWKNPRCDKRHGMIVALVLLGVAVVASAIYFSLKHRSVSTSHTPRQTQSDSWEVVRKAMDERDYDKALTLARQMVQRQPNDPYGHVVLGDIALAQGHTNEAQAHYAQACTLLPSEENKKRLQMIRGRIETETSKQPPAPQ
jgi:hypothetical protein